LCTDQLLPSMTTLSQPSVTAAAFLEATQGSPCCSYLMLLKPTCVLGVCYLITWQCTKRTVCH